MKLFELYPVVGLEQDNNPWIPWFDKCFHVIVRAKDEKTARELAQKKGSDEARGDNKVWINPEYTVCEELTYEGEEEVIVQEIAWA
jgi:hypothetical protein